MRHSHDRGRQNVGADSRNKQPHGSTQPAVRGRRRGIMSTDPAGTPARRRIQAGLARNSGPALRMHGLADGQGAQMKSREAVEPVTAGAKGGAGDACWQCETPGYIPLHGWPYTLGPTVFGPSCPQNRPSAPAAVTATGPRAFCWFSHTTGSVILPTARTETDPATQTIPKVSIRGRFL